MSGDEIPEDGLPTPAGEESGDASGNLQDRLTEHGHKLAEAAGERASEPVDGAEPESGEHQAASAEAGGAVADEAVAAPADGQLDLHEAARLPWLESDEDDGYDGGIDTRRVAMILAAGVALLAAILGGIWWGTHRGGEAEKVADGSLIKAEPGPYKSAPASPGGKTYEGTGDSSYAVSQGKNPTAHLGEAASAGAAGGAVTTAEQAGQVARAAAKSAGATAMETASAAGHATPAAGSSGHAAGGAAAGPGGGVGVQVGAYTSQASAEAGWAKLEKQYAALSGVHHRIVQGQADIGTVFRLQAVAESDGAANALCSGLKGQGLACQVKH